MHRMLFAVHRKPELTHEEFVEHYQQVHLPIARRLPKLQRYEIFPVQPAEDAGADAPDAFALMVFDSPETFADVMAGPEMAAAVEDNATFIDRFEAYTVDHLAVVTG